MKLFTVLTLAVTATAATAGFFSFQKKKQQRVVAEAGHNNLRHVVRNLQEPDLVVVGNNGSPSSAFPLQLCQGDCDTDDECSVSCFFIDFQKLYCILYFLYFFPHFHFQLF